MQHGEPQIHLRLIQIDVAKIGKAQIYTHTKLSPEVLKHVFNCLYTITPEERTLVGFRKVTSS